VWYDQITNWQNASGEAEAVGMTFGMLQKQSTILLWSHPATTFPDKQINQSLNIK